MIESKQINDALPNNLIKGDAELGALLGISIVTINRLKRKNKLPYYKCGAKYLYCLADVLNSMKNQDYEKLTSSTN